MKRSYLALGWSLALAAAAAAQAPATEALALLARALEADASPVVRSAAARRLAPRGHPAARAHLLALLADEPLEDAAFQDALAGLASLARGDDPEALEAVLEAIPGASTNSRRGAAAEVGLELAAAAAGRRARALLLDLTRLYEGPVAAAAVGSLATEGDVEALDAIVRRYTAVPGAGDAAFASLRVLDRARAEAALEALLVGPRPEARRLAVLWSTTTAGASLQDRLVQWLRTDHDPQVRATAAAALASVAPATFLDLARPLVAADATPLALRQTLTRLVGDLQDAASGPLLVQVLSEGPVELRWTAGASLGRLAWPPAAAALRQVLRSPSSGAVLRQVVAHALGAYPGPSTREALVEAVMAGPARVADTAAWTLAQDPDPAAREALLSTLAHQDPVARAAAAGALGPAPDATRALIERLVGDPDPGVRARAAEALRAAGGESRRAALVHAQGDPAEAVRQAAMFSLMLREEWARPTQALALRLLRQSPSVMIRSASLQLLGKAGTREARDALVRGAIHDEVPGIRAFCHLLLNRQSPAHALEAARASLRVDPREGIRRASAMRIGRHGATQGFPDLRRAILRDPAESVRRAAVLALSLEAADGPRP